MRIVIAGPPKTGNVWLKCLLASMYDLRALGPKTSPERPQFDAFAAWVAQGRFRDGTVFHQHYDHSDELVDAIAAVPAQIVTIVRDPYDVFVSSFFTIQKHAENENRKNRKASILIGKTLDHPDVYAWLETGGFRKNLLKARDWMVSDRTTVLRYEALIADPMAELSRLAAAIGPVPPEKMAGAIAACSADAMRQNAKTAGHVRAAKVGDSRGRLDARHLTIFRDLHADLIRSLGYEVRDPEAAPMGNGREPRPEAGVTSSATPTGNAGDPAP